MSALFDFRSFLTILLLSICSCTYVKLRAPQVRPRPPSPSRRSTLTRTRSYPQLLDPYRTGPRGVLWKLARCASAEPQPPPSLLTLAPSHSIGERLSPYVSVCCVLMGVSVLLW